MRCDAIGSDARAVSTWHQELFVRNVSYRLLAISHAMGCDDHDRVIADFKTHRLKEREKLLLDDVTVCSMGDKFQL